MKPCLKFALLILTATSLSACRSETFVQDPDDVQRRTRYVDKRFSSEKDPINLPLSERKRRRSISEVLLRDGRGDDPNEASVTLKKAFDQAVDGKTAEEALYLSAEAAFKSRILRTAYRRYLVLIDTFPQSKYYEDVLLRIFNLGKLAIEEGTEDSSVLFFLGDTDEEFGIKVLKFFVTDYNQHPNADDALFLIGTQFKKDGLQEDAIVNWQRLRAEYPTSVFARLAEFRIAQAQIELTEDVERDQKPLLLARQGLRSYTRRYLTGDDVQEAAKTLVDLENTLAKHDLRTALAYRSDDRWGGFEIYLQHILREYPKTDIAPEAKELLAEFEANKAFFLGRKSWRGSVRRALGED
jgi:outer membrane protein assembly factor BamD (BamD/ComL family)